MRMSVLEALTVLWIAWKRTPEWVLRSHGLPSTCQKGHIHFFILWLLLELYALNIDIHKMKLIVMYLYKLLFIVVLMLRNPKTVKKLQYGQIFLKESHFWWWGGNLGMDRGVKFLVFDNFLNVCTIWMSTLGMRVCFPTLFLLKPPRTYLECLKL